jgi:hypothetical protein
LICLLKSTGNLAAFLANTALSGLLAAQDNFVAKRVGLLYDDPAPDSQMDVMGRNYNRRLQKRVADLREVQKLGSYEVRKGSRTFLLFSFSTS